MAAMRMKKNICIALLFFIVPPICKYLYAFSMPRNPLNFSLFALYNGKNFPKGKKRELTSPCQGLGKKKAATKSMGTFAAA